MTSMQTTIYLPGTTCHMVLTQTAHVPLHMGMVLHMIYGKTIPATTPRKSISLITCTWTEPEDQCEGFAGNYKVEKEKKHG